MKQTCKIVLFAGAAVFIMNACSKEQKGVPEMTQNPTLNAKDALVLVKEGKAVLVDVRTPEEVEEFDLSYSIKIPLQDLPQRSKELPKDKLIITTCASGHRAQSAQEFLKEQGFNVKYNFQTIFDIK